MSSINFYAKYTEPSNKLLKHLEKLVSFDTQNPPRLLNAQSEIFGYLKEQLSGFKFQLFDAGEGCLSLLAIRGQPELLFNFHIDTVPVSQISISQGWSTDPFKLRIEKSKAYGLGACDIKGAAACILAAVNQTQGDVALLFSSDEEHGSSKAVKQFLSKGFNFKQVVVAEPTQAKAVLAHRGIQTAQVNFYGVSGHASEARAIDDSAIHQAMLWSSEVLNWVKKQNKNEALIFDSLQGLPFNIGKIEGGIKANMIADKCQLTLGFRSLPGQESKIILNELNIIWKNLIESKNNNFKLENFQLTPSFNGPTLPAENQPFELSINQAKVLAKKLDLTLGEAVDFWTEASLFSAAGYTAIVFGPGNIQQAHTIDEWVSLEQLAWVEQAYINILNKI